MTIKCARSSCDNELNTGAKYCSRSCAAKDRHEKIQLSASPTPVDKLAKQIESALGSDSRVVLSEVQRFFDEVQGYVPLPMEKVTYADLTLSFDGERDLRPATRLDFDIIDMMLRSGPVIFATEMKRSQIARVFSPGRFKVVSPDAELAEVATAALNLVLPKMANDFTWSAFAYGSSFQEEVWEFRSKYELGLSDTRNATSAFMVPKVPASVNPTTIDHIRRVPDTERFNGFAQKPKNGSTDYINVNRDASLIIPMNERFGNLWGESFLKPIYPTWLWYEVVMRTMTRYMERMATPVAVGRAPSRGTVHVEGKSSPVRAMDVILAVAGNIAKSNAAAIPSDRDENGNYLWEIDYLTADERSQPFIAVLEYLQQEMIRGSLSADRSLSQSSGGTGSYNIGDVHARASALVSELILIQFVYYLNKYFMPGFSIYNRGLNGPPIHLVTQALDMQERDILTKLMATAGNAEVSQEFLRAIDWRAMGETSNIPLLSQEEVEEERERLFKLGLDHQKKQQEMMQKFSLGGQLQPKKNQPAKSPEQVRKEQIDSEDDDGNKKLEQLPLLLGIRDYEIITG